MQQTAARFFITGGTLPPTASSYVGRQADTVLLESLRAGEFCYVLNTRQMGKSSLMVRTASRLQEDGATVVMLDLTALGHNLSAEQWYGGLLLLLAEQLSLQESLEDFWLDNTWLGPMQRWMAALRERVLSVLVGSLVIFIDEIDAVRGLSFSTDEFFAGIRECYNRRAYDPLYQHLAFCLLGVAAPTDLITETSISPFNIGTRIQLTDFTPEEAAPLATGLGVQVFGYSGIQAFRRSKHPTPEHLNTEHLLSRILYWTGGHPYMTQRLCRAVMEEIAVPVSDSPSSPAAPPTSHSLVDRLCQRLFLNKSARDSDDNLAFVRNRLLRSKMEVAAMLDLYEQVRSGRRIREDETNPLHTELWLAGIVRVQNGRFAVRNRIYERVFDRAWVRENMPDAEARRQRTAYRRGFAFASSGGALIIVIIATLAIINYRTTVRAQRAEARAVTEADYANRLLYDSNINLAQQRYEALDLTGALDLLNQMPLPPGRTAQDGFEWRYLMGQCNQPRILPLGRTIAGPFLAVSPDGKTIVAGSAMPRPDDRTIELWDATAWRRRMTAPAFGIVIGSVFAPDGKTFALSYLNGSIRLFDTATGRKLRDWSAHKNSVPALSFSPDGRTLASGSNDGTVRLWDTHTWQQTRELPAHVLRGVWTVAFSPNGKTLAAGCDDGTTRLWDTATWRLIHILRGHSWYVYSVAFSPNGSLFATGSGDKNVILWDTRTWQPLEVLHGHTSYVYAVAFSPDSKTLATGGWDKVVRLWNTETGEQRQLYRHFTSVYRLAFLSHSHHLVTASPDGRLYLWDTAREPEARTLRAVSTHQSPYVTVSPDGKLVATGSIDHVAKVWEIATGRLLCVLRGMEADMNRLAFSPNGTRIAATGGNPGLLTVWDARKGRLLRSIRVGNELGCCYFRPDDGRILVPVMRSDLEGAVISVDPVSGRTEQICSGRVGFSTGVFSHNGKYLLTASDPSRIVTLYDVATGREVRRFNIALVKCYAFSPDDRRIVVGQDDGIAQVLDTATGRPQLALKDNESGIHSCAFSADGRLVVTGGFDQTIRLWDAVTGRELLTLRGHSEYVNAVVVSPDGNCIASGSFDGTVKLWQATKP